MSSSGEDMKVVPSVQLDRISFLTDGYNTAEMKLRALLETLRQDAGELERQQRSGEAFRVGEEPYPAAPLFKVNADLRKQQILWKSHGNLGKKDF